MFALFAATVFVGAALLFIVEPMFARMVLPFLGGAPAVWNTAMVFFQAALFAAYAYAHVSTRWLGPRRQAGWHLLILIAPLAVLPIVIPEGWPPPTQGHPIVWLFGLMLAAVGLPFFAVATTSPLIQKWFASTGHRHAADPYFLYSASNAGSLLALVAYPAWLEPRMRVAQQGRLWAWSYGLFVLLTMACAACLWWSPRAMDAGAPVQPAPEASPAERPSRGRRLRWIWLSFIPSSLMLSVTTYFSSDVAVVPLFWVVPLAVYLLTFVLAFARHPLLPLPLLRRALPILLVPLVLLLNMRASLPVGIPMAIHLAAFFVAAALCHTELAGDRPPASHLTAFYLWVSLGGTLGGLFNALVAPLIFHSVLEYPLVLVALCLVDWKAADGRSAASIVRDCAWPAGLTLATAVAVRVVQNSQFRNDNIVGVSLFVVPALICYFFSRRPLRFALGLAGILAVSGMYRMQGTTVLHAERTFFGIHRVEIDPSGRFHLLVHGRVLHGRQSLDPARRREPLAYYSRSGPAGQVFSVFGRAPSETIGIVGLGAGTLMCYAQPGQHWSCFEIDPTVLKLASDTRYFTFLSDSPAPARVVLGDARLSLAAEPDRQFDLLVMDAYSSDAIPVHLVTREALALYLRKLAPGGRLAFHISNLYLDVEPVLADLARDAGLACLTRVDAVVPPKELAEGKAASTWMVMARSADDLAPLSRDPRWRPGRVRNGGLIWTDDYSSLLSILRWR